jgi:HPt (histidine-containing phosphotransfer) domain-containing protein
MNNAECTPIIGIKPTTVPSEIKLSATEGMDDSLSERSAAQDEGSVIDWQALGGYMGTDDKALLAEFFTEFLRHSTSTLAEIAQAVVAKDAPQAGALAHRLKSSARMVGANVLADTCLRLERAGLDSQWSDIHQEHALLQEHLTAVVAEAGAHGIVV